MTYIYDLILNWCRDRKYEFFEWKENDEIEYIKKIPVFKVRNFNDLFNNDIRVGKDFLDKVFNKTEVYGNKKIEKVEYACVFCDDELSKAFAIEFNDEGENLFKSIVYLYDLEDVFILGKRLDLLDLDFVVVDKREEKDMTKDGSVECAVLSEDKSLFSLITPYEYMRISLDENCKYLTSNSCANYNFLSGTQSSQWTLTGNASAEETSKVYSKRWSKNKRNLLY